MSIAIRGSVAFHTRGDASNQQTRWLLDRGVEMRCAEKELVEQPFLARRALSHQSECSLRDPGETRALLAEWGSGLWNVQGTRSRGMGPINLCRPACGLVRGCDSPHCRQLRYSCYRCQLVTHPSSEKRLQVHDLHSSASPTGSSQGHGVATHFRHWRRNQVDRLRRHPRERTAQGRAELLAPSTSRVSRIIPNDIVRFPTQEHRCAFTYYTRWVLGLRTWLGGGFMSKKRLDNTRGFKSQIQVSSSGTLSGAYPENGIAPAEPFLDIPAPHALQ